MGQSFESTPERGRCISVKSARCAKIACERFSSANIPALNKQMENVPKNPENAMTKRVMEKKLEMHAARPGGPP